MSRAEVAVVIPCRDLGRTLGEAVASAHRQIRAPAEVLVVDDGSRDPQTLRVLAELAADGLRVLRLPPSGLAAARNAGVRATLSPYVVTLDADDLLAPDYT
ncbi:MAG TPA: glycosyltransferase family A protein, partial [Thermoanaerobaculia bacterium]|nr:glycosyltransferase family A protein [Thermoanaerobaculia bacterium]